MKNLVLKNSNEFKKSLRGSILGIILFISTYFILIILSLLLIVLCGFLGYLIINYFHNFYAFVFALGILGIGLLIFVFIFKFIFKKHSYDRSLFIEISREEDPYQKERIPGF